MLTEHPRQVEIGRNSRKQLKKQNIPFSMIRFKK